MREKKELEKVKNNPKQCTERNTNGKINKFTSSKFDHRVCTSLTIIILISPNVC